MMYKTSAEVELIQNSRYLTNFTAPKKKRQFSRPTELPLFY
jgi:hypothetical protein